MQFPFNELYPRLFMAMMWAGSLSFNETQAAFRNWHDNHDAFSGEAANHFGGFHALVRAARLAHQRSMRKPSFVALKKVGLV